MSPMPHEQARGHGGGGAFIAFEGGDGAGKSTQIDALAASLSEKGREVLLTREPGGTPVGSAIRQVVLHGEHVDARAEALLFAADRAHHVATVVRPALERGVVVLTDRYMDSSVAYQGAARGADPQEIADLSAWATRGLLPDLTVLLDLDPQVGYQRRRGQHDRLESESEAFHLQVRSAFCDLAAAAPQRYLLLDAATDVADLQRAIADRVAALLDLRQ
ncbi:MAG: dTMP kinase [Ornithinimicrobium sp.]